MTFTVALRSYAGTVYVGTYEDYLESPWWQGCRERALERAGFRCERCGQGAPLNVHHRTYVRLGRELPEDLEVLCRGCHREEHGLPREEPAALRVAGFFSVAAYFQRTVAARRQAAA